MYLQARPCEGRKHHGGNAAQQQNAKAFASVHMIITERSKSTNVRLPATASSTASQGTSTSRPAARIAFSKSPSRVQRPCANGISGNPSGAHMSLSQNALNITTDPIPLEMAHATSNVQVRLYHAAAATKQTITRVATSNPRRAAQAASSCCGCATSHMAYAAAYSRAMTRIMVHARRTLIASRCLILESREIVTSWNWDVLWYFPTSLPAGSFRVTEHLK